MSSDSQRKDTSGRIPQLDGIRGIAVSGVIVAHLVLRWLATTPGTPSAYLVKFLSALTGSGVDLFFVLSGFLIGGILLEHQTATNYFQVFYLRRAYRIIPLYLVWLGLFYLCVALLPTQQIGFKSLLSTSVPLWAYLTFTQNLVVAHAGAIAANWTTVSWSLAIEEQFYLLAPATIRLFAGKKLVFLTLTLLLFSMCARFWLGSGESGLLSASYSTLTRMDGLLCGVLCAKLTRNTFTLDLLKRYRPALLLLIGLCPLGAFLLANAKHIGSLVHLGYLCYAIGYAGLLLSAVLFPLGLLGRITSGRALRSLGILAYGLYLMHVSINELCHASLRRGEPDFNSLSGIAVTLLAALITLALTLLSWRKFELPLVQLSHRFNYQLVGPTKVR